MRRLGVLAKRPDAHNGALTEALEADALLLREENARLRVKLEAPPNAGEVIERLRALPVPTPSANGDHAEESWQMLTEILVMRNSLIEICKQIGQVMAGLESSLQSLSPPDPGTTRDSVARAAGAGGSLDFRGASVASVDIRGDETVRNGSRINGHLEEARQS